MPHGLDHIAGAGLALGADHGRALANPPQRFAQVAAAAHERDREIVFVDVMGFVRGREHFRLVNEIRAD